MDGTRVPTGACLLKRIGGSSYKDTRNSCDKMLECTLRAPRNRLLLKKPVITGTDDHDIPVHFKDIIEEYMTKGMPKGGTSKKLRFTTVKIVGGHVGLTVAIHLTGKKHKKADIVRLQLKQMENSGVKSKSHLLDKGFCNTETIRALLGMKQRFIMPAVKTSKVKAAIESYAAGTGNAVVRYTMRNKNKNIQVTVTLVMVKKRGAKKTDPVTEQYVAFVTDASLHKAMALLANIPEEYRKRWDIETGYRCAKQIRPVTCSKNPSIRLVLFYFTMIMYNVWVYSNWIANGGVAKGSIMEGTYVRPVIEMYRMQRSFRRTCEKMIKRGIIMPDVIFADVH